jgi:hypothetical protein
MPRCRVDPDLNRTVSDATGHGFAFPLGVYPIEPMIPIPGYTVEFEPADTGEEGQFEEWPDRYLFEIVITAERLEPLCRSLLGLLPGRIYPILDYLGHDQYREVDPYISYDLIGTDRLLEAIRRYRGFFYEDGLCGFGAMTDDPFLYIFIDEHKVITVRCEAGGGDGDGGRGGGGHRDAGATGNWRERVEKILHAFDLDAVASPAGADAAAHEHRTVLITTDDRPDLLTADEIIEDLCEEWNLVLNVDPDTNLDDEGNDLGIIPWRCLVRISIGDHDGPESHPPPANEPSDARSASDQATPPAEPAPVRYADVVLTAASLRAAEEMALDAVDEMTPDGPWDEASVVFADRVRPELLEQFIKKQTELKDSFPHLASRRRANEGPENSLAEERIIWTGWLE